MKLVCKKIEFALIIIFAVIVNCIMCTFANNVLDDSKIYEIKNPDCNCYSHSNYDYFLGSGKSLFKSDEKEHRHYYGVRDVKTGEIKIIREIKFRETRDEERYASDPGYRCVSVKYYDNNKNLVYTFLNDTNDSDIAYLWDGDKKDIVYTNYLIIDGRRTCVDLNSGKEDKIMLGKYNEYVNNEKKKKEKQGVNINNDKNGSVKNENSTNNVTDNSKKTIEKKKVSFNYSGNKVSGYQIDDIYIAFANDKTFILGKNNELIKELPIVYEDVDIITNNDAKILIYEFKHGGEQFYRDAYDEKFNMIFEKIESCSYEDDCEFISVNRKDSGIYDEGNYFDGLYTTLYDENFNVVKKFDTIKEISAGYYNKKDCYFVDDYGYSGHMDDGLYREIYDKDFKLIKDNIIDMSSFKNPNNNIIYIIITDGVSTKIYKDDKLVKDLKYRLLNTHRDYETIEFILKFDNQYSDYFRGVYPIIYLKDKIFIRTNDGAKVLDDKFEIKLEGYKEFIDFNEEYFTFFKDKSYGIMDYDFKELVKFDRE